ncbi:hypothetical protein G5T42_06120 [Microbacterium sp. 4R-513]|uniref:hypothetical protein n=1 Tax=Microbacterium sp. 4R-513 TaxID=2567934 RepID=UPI0013E1B353|nr:hypothetical protein [Microbacterium sp. 4R-513]QIG39116.1 hypothetical protein G5T42_06120 [Microbacterium sp. 4R-513]
MTRIGVRAALLAPLGVLFLLLAARLYHIVPELTMDNMDELLANRSYTRLSRAFAFPLGIGLGLILASVILIWRRVRIALIKAAHPSAIVLEVTISKEAKKELALSAPALASAWSHVLVIRENSISLWSGLPPQHKEFIEAAQIRTLEYVNVSPRGRARADRIVLEWTDVLEWRSDDVTRRLELTPIGGLLGNSAPASALTAHAVESAQKLLALRPIGR